MTLVSVARRFFHAILPVQCATCDIALSDDPVPFFCRSCWTPSNPYVVRSARAVVVLLRLPMRFSIARIICAARADATLPRTPARGLCISMRLRFKRQFACLNTTRKSRWRMR